MSPHRTLPLAVLVATLSACSGGGGDGGDNGSIGPINCAALTGASAAAGATCAGGTCGQTFTDAANDHDLGTYAILEMANNASGNVHIRVTAADGVTYPAGTPAAVVYGIVRTEGNSLGTTETLSTYLDGMLQETGNTVSNAGVTSDNRDTGRRAMSTSLPFDAIEFTYAQSGGTADVEVRVHEFCTSVN